MNCSTPVADRKSDAGSSKNQSISNGLFEHAGVQIGQLPSREAAAADLTAIVATIGTTSAAASKQVPPPRKKIKIVDDKTGHRERLRARFCDGGADAMPDYELLEMILFRVYPRGDTKPLARSLLAHFKTFNEVINAPADRLREVQGIGDRAVQEIKLVQAVARRLLKSELVSAPVLGAWHAVLDYCRAVQAYDPVERFRILFLDKRNRLLGDEVQQTGTVDHTPVYVREIIKRAFELGSTALVLVHNHPSGDPTPSRADIDMTRMIVDAAKPLGIVIHDHIIVGRSGHFSLRAEKMM